jgi:hypothetical protein
LLFQTPLKNSLLALVLLASPAAAQTPAAVEAVTLGGVDAFRVGLPQPGIPDAVWRGSDVTLLSETFSRLGATASRSPAALALQRAVLTAALEGPGKTTDELNLRRLRAIYAAGGVAAVRAMLPRMPGSDSAGFQQLAADSALLSGRLDDACAIEQSIKTERAQAPWVRLRALCQVVAKDQAADLTLTLARTTGVRDEGYLAALSALQGGTAPKAFTVRGALDLATARRLPSWQAVDVQKATLPVLVALATATDVPADQRLQPAWKAASVGAIDGATLTDVMLAQPGPQAPVAADLVAADKTTGVTGLAALVRVALKTADLPTAITAAYTALKRAQTPGEVRALSGVLKPVLAQLNPDVVSAPQLWTLTLAAALADEDTIATALATGAPFTPGQITTLALARGDGVAAGAALDQWITVAAKGDNAAKLAVVRLYPVLTAVGAPVPAATRRTALDFPAAPVTGAKPNDGVMGAMWSAVARKAHGEVATLALVAVGDAGPAAMDRTSLASVLVALNTSGLGSYARGMALEVALADTLHPQANPAPAKPVVKPAAKPAPKKPTA